MIQYKSFEQFLGKKVDKLMGKEGHIIHEDEISDEIVYGLDQMEYMGYNCRSFSIITNRNKEILQIYFGIDQRIDKAFFEVVKKKYGTPSNMFKLKDDETTVQSEFHSLDYTIKSVRGAGIECEFNESPNFIVWKRDDYKFTITLPPNENHTLISYRKI